MAKKITTALVVLLLLLGVGATTSVGGMAFRYATAVLDPSFGGGMVTVDFVNPDLNLVPVPLPDGDIVAVGGLVLPGFKANIVLARYNPDGTLDVGFSGDGKMTLDDPVAAPRDDGGFLAVSQRDGKILVLVRHGELARVDAGGSLDTTFGGGDGVASINFGTESITGGTNTDFALQPDGKIVVSEASDDPQRTVLTRLNSDGSVDTSFGGGGNAPLESGLVKLERVWLRSIKLQRDGKILGVDEGHLYRLNRDGSLDTSFDNDGVAETENVGESVAEPLPNGKILRFVTGKSTVGGVISSSFFKVERYTAGGEVDQRFFFGGDLGLRGKVTPASRNPLVWNTSAQQDGRIVLSTTAGDGDVPSTLVRFDKNGMPQSVVEMSRHIWHSAVQNDGKILVASWWPYDDSGSNFRLERVLAPPSIGQPKRPRGPKSVKAKKPIWLRVDCPLGCMAEARIKIGRKTTEIPDKDVTNAIDVGVKRHLLKFSKKFQRKLSKLGRKKKSKKVTLLVRLVSGGGTSKTAKIAIR